MTPLKALLAIAGSIGVIIIGISIAGMASGYRTEQWHASSAPGIATMGILSQTPIPGIDRRAMLGVSCINGSMGVIVRYPDSVHVKNGFLNYAFDNGDWQQDSWDASDGKSLMVSSRAAHFVAKMILHNTFTVEVETPAGPLKSEFDTSGLEHAITPYQAECGIP